MAEAWQLTLDQYHKQGRVYRDFIGREQTATRSQSEMAHARAVFAAILTGARPRRWVLTSNPTLIELARESEHDKSDTSPSGKRYTREEKRNRDEYCRMREVVRHYLRHKGIEV